MRKVRADNKKIFRVKVGEEGVGNFIEGAVRLCADYNRHYLNVVSKMVLDKRQLYLEAVLAGMRIIPIGNAGVFIIELFTQFGVYFNHTQGCFVIPEKVNRSSIESHIVTGCNDKNIFVLFIFIYLVIGRSSGGSRKHITGMGHNDGNNIFCGAGPSFFEHVLKVSSEGIGVGRVKLPCKGRSEIEMSLVISLRMT
ncbi:MAG: hypothetical protein BWY70_00470 [Bacteroidetes bacterium ADurb.Bin408]|nr:MAG: hypothetical protein BWY70_00470 [Bacteroidetes bacterium ADurb.Bin408]